MNIKLYGVRGSIPAPTTTKEYKKKIREILKFAIQNQLNNEEHIDDFLNQLPMHLTYLTGGNTTCVTVRTKEKFYILDAGTGIRVLGDEIFQNQNQFPKEIHIFITHTHWDHIQGLPFFKPLYLPQYTLHFYSGFPDIEERLYYQTDERFFPMPIYKTASKKYYHHFDIKKPLKLEDSIEIHSFPLKHPGGCFSYKFINLENNKIFIFATDVEFTGEDFLEKTEYLEYFGNADILILDSQYTLDESFLKIDWGHTSYTMAINCATHWKVKNLILTHHEPAYSDEKLFNNYINAIRHRQLLDKERPKIFLAKEGMELEL
ncbi:MAG: hydrolase [Leptospiraceae bacterium]|nr:MAG: hydrolase [Leptospiraceae bacterium]